MTGSSRLPWGEARRIAHSSAPALGTENVPLAQGVGRWLGADLLALSDVPHYASSAMDGWAVNGEGPWKPVSDGPLELREAAPIVTGGVIPQGAIGVLRSEDALIEGGRVSAASGGSLLGRHIRPVGGESVAGDVVVRRGVFLNPAQIALAAACGQDALDVVRRPRIEVVLTGDEVQLEGIPGPGRVRDSFGPQLPTVIGMLGATVSHSTRLRDSRHETVAAIAAGAGRSDLVLTTGGTGSSSADHLRGSLGDLGAELLVDGIRMRPGGPSLLARLADGRLLIGLPGNPLAAMLGLVTLLHPVLAGFAGAPLPEGSTVLAAEALAGRPETTVLAPFRMTAGRAIPTRWNGSGMMRGLANATGVLVVPPAGIDAGQPAEALPLPWYFG